MEASSIKMKPAARRAVTEALQDAGAARPKDAAGKARLNSAVSPYVKDGALTRGDAQRAIADFLGAARAPARASGVPAYLSADSVQAWHHVNLGNEQSKTAVAYVKVGEDPQALVLNWPLRGTDPDKMFPTVNFTRDDKGERIIGTIPSQRVEGPLAAQLLPFLDRAAVSAGDPYAKQVVEAMRQHAERMGGGETHREAHLRLYTEAAKTCDGGNYPAGIRKFEELTRSPMRGLRGHTYYTIAHATLQVGETARALSAAEVALGLARELQQPSLERDVERTIADIYRDRREFAAALPHAERAVALAEELRAGDKPEELSRAYFALAVIQKNLGDMKGAVMHMAKALEARDAPYIRVALAGYYALVGESAKAQATFTAVAVPAEGLKRLDYFTNRAWFYALMKDADAVVESASEAMRIATQMGYPGTREYLRAEVDFDPFRADARFAALCG